MDRHGVHDWSLKLSGSKRRLGSCAYRTKTLRLSRHLLSLNTWAQVQDTILHEIAHALVGVKHGHDKAWRAKAIELGAAPRACAAKGEIAMPTAPWEAWCPACAELVGRYYRRPPRWRRGYIHNRCRKRIQFRRHVPPAA
jgi:predicted SprT family Zn-dependent metalloprotease